MTMDKPPIPVTILTGFLGAGKTTLLNKLFQDNPSVDFLIIENEAGDTNIDSLLIEKKSKSNVIGLTGGCICCSLNSELGIVLNNLIISELRYDHLLIEATGIADPAEIIQVFMGQRAQKYFRLDAVVGLVDAALFQTQFSKYPEIRKQIAQSDLVLINKADQVTPEQITDITQMVSSVNPFAQIEQTVFGKGKELQILNSNAFQPQKLEKSVIDFSSISLFQPPKHSKHDIQAHSFTLIGQLSAEKFSLWLEDYLFTNTGNILRIKGVLSIDEMKHKIILQVVAGNYQVLPGSLWDKEDERVSRMVFIGSDLNRDELLNELELLTTKS
jgi:G3E family GTPase